MSATGVKHDETKQERIGSARGIVFVHTAGGGRVPAPDIERWLRLNRTVFKCDKVDMIVNDASFSALARLRPAAEPLDVRISLRTNCSTPPPAIAMLRDARLWDVFLCPVKADAPEFDAWLHACHEADLPVRVQIHTPFDVELDTSVLADRLAQATVVHIAANDPFTNIPPARNALHSAASVQKSVEIARAVAGRGVEVNLIGFPFCAVPEDLWPLVVNQRQFFLDHQQYKCESFELAAALYRRNPTWVRQAVLIRLGQHTSTNNPIDRILLPWIMDHPWVRARVWALHKLTRHRKSAVPASPATAELEAERLREVRKRARGPVCGVCRMQRICDSVAQLEKRLPGITIVSQPGEEIVDPLAFARGQHKYYDALDAAQRDALDVSNELAQRANALVTNTAPTREIDSLEYKVE